VEDLSKINKDLQGYFELMQNNRIKSKQKFKKFIKNNPKKWQEIQQKKKKKSS
jgi:uncharacterized protein (DUF1697 family)